MIAITLALVLLVWRLVDGNVTVSQIEPRRAELFDWTAILVSNMLGAALGALITLTALIWRFTKASPVVLFWIAFVLTRPFDATFGDLLTKPLEKGGPGFGTVGASLVVAALMIACLVYSERRARAILAAHPRNPERWQSG